MVENSKPRLERLLKKVGALQPDEPIGVVDIGSNSIRLVGYSGSARTPLPIYNERAFCRLGTSVAQTGRIEGEPKELALLTLARFRAIADQMGIENFFVFATAAVRQAENRSAFVAEAEAALGQPIRVLTGEEEALLSTSGVAMSIPDAEGIVADLGGGSLELGYIKNGQLKEWASLNLGVLPLQELGPANKAPALKEIRRQLGTLPWLKRLNKKTIYTVGGTWRNLARVQMDHVGYELDVLHQYEVAASKYLPFLKLITRMDLVSIAGLRKASKSRRESLPYASLLLTQLIQTVSAEQVVVSAAGVREGVVFEMLKPKYKALDPLLLACEEVAERMSKSSVYGHELADWTSNLFVGEKLSPEFERYRYAACLVSDIGWSNHPNSRADIASNSVLRAPFNGVSHKGRIFMATALAYRHEQNSGGGFLAKVPNDWPEFRRGQVLGLSFRLAHSLSASLPGVLPKIRLKRTAKYLTLDLRDIEPNLVAPIIENRLRKVANLLELKIRIET